MSSQQMLLGAGKPPVKYYVDDVFSAHGWLGNSSTYPYTQTVNNGINLLDDGGLVWVKNRDGVYQNLWMSTNLGVGKDLTPTSAAAVNTGGSSRMAAYYNNGFKVGNDTTINNNGQKIMSWTFKKSKGFFDICEWSGNGTARTISHNLECLPGFIIIKSTTIGSNWMCWHRGMNIGEDNLDHWAYFNGNGATYTAAQMGYSSTSILTGISDTGFTLMADGDPDEGYGVNRSGQDYVAYVFAGGESTATNATSVRFGSNYHLNPGTSSDFTLGTGDYTIEFWWKQDHTSSVPLFDNRTTGEVGVGVSYDGFYIMALGPSSGIRVWWNNEHGAQGGTYAAGVWNHCAVTRSSNVTRIFINGELVDTESSQTIDCTGNQAHIGGNKSSGTTTISSLASNTNISNFRLVKATALYTADFKPSTEPLTNVTNNNSSYSSTKYNNSSTKSE